MVVCKKKTKLYMGDKKTSPRHKIRQLSDLRHHQQLLTEKWHQKSNLCFGFTIFFAHLNPTNMLTII